MFRSSRRPGLPFSTPSGPLSRRLPSRSSPPSPWPSGSASTRPCTPSWTCCSSRHEASASAAASPSSRSKRCGLRWPAWGSRVQPSARRPQARGFGRVWRFALRRRGREESRGLALRLTCPVLRWRGGSPRTVHLLDNLTCQPCSRSLCSMSVSVASCRALPRTDRVRAGSSFHRADTGLVPGERDR